MSYNKKQRIAIYLFTGLLVMFHIAMVPGSRDDLWFSAVLDSYGPFEYLAMRYQTWTARLFPELLLIFFSRHLILWKIANIAVCCFIAFEILDITGLKDPVPGFISILIFPLWCLSETGWCTTFMCYVWPLAAGLFPISVLKACFEGKKVSLLKTILAGFLLLYAAGSEQIAVISLCLFAFSFALGISRHNRQLWLLSVIYALETLCMMAFSLTCPGNAARVVAETKAHMPEFSGFSMIDKAVLGVNSTFSELAMGDLIPFFFFGVLVLTALYSKKKPGLILGLSGAVYYAAIYAAELLNIDGFVPKKLENVQAYGFICLNVCVAAVIITALILTAIDLCQGLLLGVIFGSGFLSRVMLGFSPTCFESGHRTFAVYDVTLLVCGLILLGNTGVFRNVDGKERNLRFQICMYAGLLVLMLAETVYLTLFL